MQPVNRRDSGEENHAIDDELKLLGDLDSPALNHAVADAAKVLSSAKARSVEEPRNPAEIRFRDR